MSHLTKKDIEIIDQAILSCAKNHFLKQAMLVLKAQKKVEQRLHPISLTIYSMRIQYLVNKKLLEAKGNLKVMRGSEVRKIEC